MILEDRIQGFQTAEPGWTVDHYELDSDGAVTDTDRCAVIGWATVQRVRLDRSFRQITDDRDAVPDLLVRPVYWDPLAQSAVTLEPDDPELDRVSIVTPPGCLPQPELVDQRIRYLLARIRTLNPN